MSINVFVAIFKSIVAPGLKNLKTTTALVAVSRLRIRTVFRSVLILTTHFRCDGDLRQAIAYLNTFSPASMETDNQFSGKGRAQTDSAE